jgi:hypothetical protein
MTLEGQDSEYPLTPGALSNERHRFWVTDTSGGTIFELTPDDTGR